MNIRSLRKKFHNLKILLHQLKIKFSVIVLTETWLDTEPSNLNLALPDYTFFCCNRQPSKKGGGLDVMFHRMLSLRL